MIRYHAGNENGLSYKVQIDMDQTDQIANDIRARFIEFWCLENCDGDWSVTETEKNIEISFDRELEMALFKLGPEYQEH